MSARGIAAPRRNLFGHLVAGAVGATVAAVPAMSAESGDAELIALCERYVEIADRQRVLYDIRREIEDEERTQPEMDRCYATLEEIFDLIAELPAPTTIDGLRAVARTALVLVIRDANGEISWRGESEWLAYLVAEVLAGQRGKLT